MALHVFDHVTRTKKLFESVRPGKVGMYVCGMTVQDRPHVGHMFAFVACDMIRRYFEYLDYEVEHIQNFTDIDDKIIEKANEEGISYRDVADRNIDIYYEYAEKLGLQPAHRYPLVTDHIDEIVAYIETLIEKDHAYAADGDVYFNVRSYAEYGQLSGRHVDDMRSGVRIEVGDNKRDPLDFALWKSAKPDEPAWDSPWGRGRPGWHIECSVMSTKYLGDYFDLHGGGRDLLFPHHENELAQSVCCSGQDYVNHWMHNGLLYLGDKKMSKSDGNFFSIEEVTEQFSPMVIRFFLLSAHFRSQLDYSEDRLREAAAGYDRLARGIVRLLEKIAAAEQVDPVPEGMVSEPGEVLAKAVRDHRRRFFAAMDDDFNSGGAIGVLFALIRDLNQYFTAAGAGVIDLAPLTEARRQLEEGNQILNLFPDGFETLMQTAVGEIPTEVQQLVRQRDQARLDKDWARADELRDEIQALGYQVEDSPDGTKATRA